MCVRLVGLVGLGWFFVVFCFGVWYFFQANNPSKELQTDINDSLKTSTSLRFHSLLLELENEIMEMPAVIPLTFVKGKTTSFTNQYK